MKPARTATDFTVKHDPATLIAKLSKSLTEVSEQLDLQNAITALLGNVAERLATLNPPAWTLHHTSGDAPGVPTLFISDVHAGEVVKADQVGGTNVFNMAVLAKRMRYTTETAIHLCRILDKDMRYPGLVMPLGGDMVSGDIHEELMVTNELATIPTVLELYELLVSAINLLLQHFPNIFLPCVSGNHGRNTRKTWAKNRNHTSFDWLLYQMLAKRYADDKRVTFYIPGGSDALYKVAATRYLLTHGDQFKAGDSIIGPIGPIYRGNQKKLARNRDVGQDYDVMILGHWHQYIHDERTIVNGSMKGYDEYAAANNFRFEKPRQALWVTHHKYGMTYRMPVLCEPVKDDGRKVDWVSIPK